MTDAVFFYLFAALVLGGAIFTVTRRNAVHSAISLIVSLIGVARTKAKTYGPEAPKIDI